jgi:hypothetical protein
VRIRGRELHTIRGVVHHKGAEQSAAGVTRRNDHETTQQGSMIGVANAVANHGFALLCA